MGPLQRLTQKLLARGTQRWYLRREKRRAALPKGGRALSILFTRRDPWEGPIREGFRGLPHRLHFDDIPRAELEHYDLIVPLSLDDARFMRRQAAHLRARTLPLPSEDCTALCHDKPRLNRFLIDAGFGAHVPAMGDDLPPPFVCKPASGENSDDCVLVPDAASLLRLGPALAQPGLFRQVAVPGAVEYATHFLLRDGVLVRELTVQYHHDLPLFIKGSDNPALVLRRLGTCPDLSTILAMLRAIGYEGLGCANYKFEGGRLQLLEINPRMGGSLGEYFFSFLRSMPHAQRTQRAGCTNWTWLDSVVERESSLGGA